MTFTVERKAFCNFITIPVRVNMILGVFQYLKIEVKHYIYSFTQRLKICFPNEID